MMLVVPNTAAVLDPFELCSQHSVLPYLLPTAARGSPLARQGEHKGPSLVKLLI